MDCKTSPRRRAYSTNQIMDYNPATKFYTPSDPSSAMTKNPLRRTKAQELIGQMGPEHEAQWRKDYQVRLPGLPAGLPALMLIPLILWVAFSRSWRVCVPPCPEGPPWAGPGSSLSRSPFRCKNPKIPTVVSIRLRKSLRPSARHMLLAAGTTGPGRPPTAHH